MLEDILLEVNKPARYIGGEWNISRKDFSQAEIKFALCFADLYEVGMSNLGLRIIYDILNNTPGVVCERFFAYAPDMDNALRLNHMETFSLESRKALREFDIVGFSLGYELNYINALNVLELGLLPLKSSLRDETHPLIIAGGPCALNPEPMHEFFDLFVIGEAEEAILEIIEVYHRLKGKYKARKISKRELLVALSGISGVYVPSLYEVSYDARGEIDNFKANVEGAPLKIKKRFIKDLNQARFPLDWLLPYIQIVHDRITLEVMRGCPNTCRFCQARSQYFPFRIRDEKNILKLADRTYRSSGYEELSLCGLSVSDYPNIEGLLKDLIDFFKEKKVSVSLPSLKPKAMVGDLSGLIATIKKTGLTFAPEAGSIRLRKVLNKDFDLDDFYKAIEKAYLSGYQHIKLYFMIGLPGEEDKDLDAIIDFAISVSDLKKKVLNKGAAQVNISVNTLIPKPHTPFQWLKMPDLETIKYKQDYLKKKLKNKRLNLNFHNPYTSILEGVLSRGDRRLSEVISSVFNHGLRFSEGDNYLIFKQWVDAFAETKIDYNFYLKEKLREEILPWDFLDVGMNKEAFLEEFNKAIAIA